MEYSDGKIIQVMKDDEDLITPAQKLVFLKYMQLNSLLISKPRSCGKMLNLLCEEHNRICSEISSEEILGLMEKWVSNMKQRFNQMISSRKSFAFSTEDVELLNLLNTDKQKPNANELSCILDHLEIAYSAPKVWVTISLEMEALGSKKSEDYWKKAFEKYCNKVKRKKRILDEMGLQPFERNSFLNALDLRVLDLLEKIECQENKANQLCRICMQMKENELLSIHDESSDDLSVAQKISQCADVEEATRDDALPQHICGGCHELLESAYKFKSLCEYSDQQLRSLSKGQIEYVEYIVEEVDVTENLDIEIQQEDKKNDGEVSIEMNLSFDNELNVEEKDINENEASDPFDESLRAEKEWKGVEDSEVHQCEICGVVCYNKETLKKHLNTHTFARPHACDVCQKEFKTKLSLRIHMRSHTGERPYVCEVCGKAFTQDATLSYHRAIHTGEKPYLCNLCNYRARNVNDLKIHTRKHTGARPYHCDICTPTRKFTTSSNLQKHLRRHTGIQNYQECGKAFKTWSAATNHRATHATVKQFHCQHCPYKANTKANLKVHSRTHTGIQPYHCGLCPLKFSTASNRHKHIKNVHEKVKKHKCSTCSRSFFSRDSARKHMVIHTGLKPYTCSECSMSYGWYNGLQKHMKIQHPDVKMPTEKYYLDLLVEK